MKPLYFSILCALLFCGRAEASFEGTMELKMTVAAGGTGKVLLAIGKTGVLNEMEMNAQGMSMKMTALMKTKEPKTIYLIDRGAKTYSEIDAKTAAPDNKKYTAKKLGQEKVNGWDTVHAQVSDGEGTDIEVWTNDKVADWRAFLSTMGNQSPASDGMMKALEGVGAAGFIVKMVAKNPKNPGAQMVIELVKVEKKSLPASTFELPSGFKKTEQPGIPSGLKLPPDAEKQLLDQLKNLPPEQQEAIRRAMKGQAPE